MSHKKYMSICAELANQAKQSGNSPVGSVLVYKDAIIGEGIESTKPSSDLTNHAEINAIRDAIRKGNLEILSQSTLYSTHEPCIMCSYVIRQHRIPQIIFGQTVKPLGGYSGKFKVLLSENISGWDLPPTIVENIQS